MNNITNAKAKKDINLIRNISIYALLTPFFYSTPIWESYNLYLCFNKIQILLLHHILVG